MPRYGEEPLIPGVQFKSSSEIYQHYQARMSHLRQDRFVIVLLDSKHRFISDQTVSIGILNRNLVHPHEVFAGVFEQRAPALICFHNHPSGDSKPSEEDNRITCRLLEAGELIRIPDLDHVIIGQDNYISFADEELL